MNGQHLHFGGKIQRARAFFRSFMIEALQDLSIWESW